MHTVKPEVLQGNVFSNRLIHVFIKKSLRIFLLLVVVGSATVVWFSVCGWLFFTTITIWGLINA